MEKIKAVSIKTPNFPDPDRTLFYGIDWLYGGWLLTTWGTLGSPVTLKDYENDMSRASEMLEADDEEFYAVLESEKNAIEELIERDEGIPANAAQLVYLNEWREIWGL